jgi:hypothetical protein
VIPHNKLFPVPGPPDECPSAAVMASYLLEKAIKEHEEIVKQGGEGLPLE